MKRARKIVLISHCYLNVNAKIEGIALNSSVFEDLIQFLIKNHYGIIQLPCVEQHVCGIKRWGQVSNQLDNPHFRSECRRLLEAVVEQVIDFKNNGYEIIGVIGVNGSPSCGVDYTCVGNLCGDFENEIKLKDKLSSVKMENKYGIMMEELKNLFIKNNLDINFVALDEANPEDINEYLSKKLINKN